MQSLLVGLLVGWYVYEAIAVHPHYLAYFNQFVGGPQSGYRHLVDSNLDWGQDLKGLKSYMDRNGIETIRLSYFGTADPSQYDIPYDALPSFVTSDPPTQWQEFKKGEILAISVTNLYPLYVDLAGLAEYLRETRPKDHIGHSIHIYELDRPLRIPPER
jgi:hypothetical protein